MTEPEKNETKIEPTETVLAADTPAETREPQQAAANHHVPFSQALRIPQVYTRPNMEITMREACVRILPGPCTKMWTYDGMFPGPTIRRPSGNTTRVTFVNKLPKHVGSTSVHHHGAHAASMFDGSVR